MGDIRLFVSHSHTEPDPPIARGLVDLIETALVRDGRILCTSHTNKEEYGYPPKPGQRQDPDAEPDQQPDLSEHLREHLSEAACVVAVLTPNSLHRPWCLFELGGAWARATKTYPLLAGGLTEEDLLGPLRGKPYGQLGDPRDIRRLLLNLRTRLGWDERNMELATHQIDELARLVQGARWPT